MADNKISLKYVKGISKKNNYPYYAIEVNIPTIAGTTLKKLVFIRDLEMQLIGVTPDDFIDKDSK